jgi:hypothetical protein
VTCEEELAGLCLLWPRAALRYEGGKPLIFLPEFQVKSGGQVSTMDLLLCPHQHSGYVTRLFFRQQLGRGANWSVHAVCGEQWWAPSWKDVQPNQSWPSMLANHLKAVE